MSEIDMAWGFVLAAMVIGALLWGLWEHSMKVEAEKELWGWIDQEKWKKIWTDANKIQYVVTFDSFNEFLTSWKKRAEPKLPANYPGDCYNPPHIITGDITEDITVRRAKTTKGTEKVTVEVHDYTTPEMIDHQNRNASIEQIKQRRWPR